MQPRVAVVTGTTSGIGRWIALGLARAGLHVVMVVRDAQRGEATRRWLTTRHQAASTEIITADLSLLAQARMAAQNITAAHPEIAVLVNNAGVFRSRRTVTAEDRELTLAVNHLAPFVLTRELEPALRAGAPSRIVNIGSEASDKAHLDLDDLEAVHSFGAPRTYGRAKLALMMASFEWARRLEGSGVTVNVVHPGLVATDIVRLPDPAGLFWKLGKPFMMSAEKGADTPLYVALAPELAGITGKYFKRRREVRPNPQALDPGTMRRLWTETESLIRA